MIIEFKDTVWLIALSWIIYKIVRFIISSKTFILYKEVINLLFFLSILFISSLTVFPLRFEEGPPGERILLPFLSIYFYFCYLDPVEIAMNIGGNILLFVPLGFVIPLKFKKVNRIWKAAIIGFSVSFAVECIQLTMPYRWFEIDDIILNTLGTMLGYIWSGITINCKTFIVKSRSFFNS